MTIFIYGTVLSGFTSSIPMRGLVLELIKIRKDDKFILQFNKADKDIYYLRPFFSDLEKLNNTALLLKKYSKKIINLKAIIGLKNYLNIDINADLYICPGTIDSFGERNVPLINILADLSQIRTPEYTSVPWHGKYILKNLLKHTFKYATKIICISDYTKTDLINLNPKMQKKTITVYNGIENEWFNEKYDTLEIDAFSNCKSGFWIWYGYISKRKNLLNLLKAYKLLIDRKINLEIPKIVFVGKIAPNQKIIADFITNNLNDSVRIIPHQDIYKLKYLVKKSKGLLFPSYYEGFGLPVIEAFTQGKPVMHSNTSSLPEIANGLGISCDAYSIESIMTALMEMIELKDDEKTIQKRKQWANRFTYNNAAIQFSKIIDKVLQGENK